MPQNEVYHRRCWLAPRGKKVRFQGEADFCQGHPAQIWWTVIPGPSSLLVVHYLENFVDITLRPMNNDQSTSSQLVRAIGTAPTFPKGF